MALSFLWLRQQQAPIVYYRRVVGELYFQSFTASRLYVQCLMIFAFDCTAHAHRIGLLRSGDGTQQEKGDRARGFVS
jgi:hypothetical protein